MIEFNDKSEPSTFDSVQCTQYETLSVDTNYDLLTKNDINTANIGLAHSSLVEETPIAISINGTNHAVMMITPYNLKAFAIGFAFSERLIESAEDIRDIEIDTIPQDYGSSFELNLILSPERFFLFRKSRKLHLGATGCGLCGKESLEHAFPSLTVLRTCEPISTDLLPSLNQQLSESQTVGRESGAMHAALLLSPQGDVIICMEDIGRHNALDKVIGYALSESIDLYQHSVVLSSRCSTELVQKAVSAGLSRLIHLASPSHMAVVMARKLGLHLIHLPKLDAPRQYSPLSFDECASRNNQL